MAYHWHPVPRDSELRSAASRCIQWCGPGLVWGTEFSTSPIAWTCVACMVLMVYDGVWFRLAEHVEKLKIGTYEGLTTFHVWARLDLPKARNWQSLSRCSWSWTQSCRPCVYICISLYIIVYLWSFMYQSFVTLFDSRLDLRSLAMVVYRVGNLSIEHDRIKPWGWG